MRLSEKLKSKREVKLCICVCIHSMCEYKSGTGALTCCAGHTSHSGDLLIQDIHCRLSTDHRPPLAPLTAAERYTTMIKNCEERFKVFSIFFLFMYGLKMKCSQILQTTSKS